jgi:hypothetical protein
VSGAVSAITIITGASKSSGSASALGYSSAATSVAVTAAVDPSGPAIVKRSEPRAAMMAD